MRNDAIVLAQLEAAFALMQSPIAVRSSAVGEDSETASFAGQHATVLNVMTFSQLISAIAGSCAVRAKSIGYVVSAKAGGSGRAQHGCGTTGTVHSRFSRRNVHP